jgi:hypothetical protein
MQKLNRQSDKEQQRREKCIPIELGAAREWYAESEERQRWQAPPQNRGAFSNENSLRSYRKWQHEPGIKVAE